MPDPIPAASIEPRPDGPYQVKGAPHLHDSSGLRMAVEGMFSGP